TNGLNYSNFLGNNVNPIETQSRTANPMTMIGDFANGDTAGGFRDFLAGNTGGLSENIGLGRKIFGNSASDNAKQRQIGLQMQKDAYKGFDPMMIAPTGNLGQNRQIYAHG